MHLEGPSIKRIGEMRLPGASIVMGKITMGFIGFSMRCGATH